MSHQQLLAQQQMLLGGLFDSWPVVQTNQAMASQQMWPQDQYQRGLQAYRSNASLLAQRVLAARQDSQRDSLALPNTSFLNTMLLDSGDRSGAHLLSQRRGEGTHNRSAGECKGDSSRIHTDNVDDTIWNHNNLFHKLALKSTFDTI